MDVEVTSLRFCEAYRLISELLDLVVAVDVDALLSRSDEDGAANGSSFSSSLAVPSEAKLAVGDSRSAAGLQLIV